MSEPQMLIPALVAVLAWPAAGQPAKPAWSASVQLALEHTRPLKHPRGSRLPLYLWPAMGPGRLDGATAETLVRQLNDRGVGLVSNWNHARFEASLAEALPVARAQKKLGLPVNVNATA